MILGQFRRCIRRHAQYPTKTRRARCFARARLAMPSGECSFVDFNSYDLSLFSLSRVVPHIVRLRLFLCHTACSQPACRPMHSPLFTKHCKSLKFEKLCLLMFLAPNSRSEFECKWLPSSPSHVSATN